MRLERIGAMTCAVGESPLWDDRRQCWYWVDITARTIWQCDRMGATRSWQTDEMVACIALAGDGDLIAGMETGIFRLRLNVGGEVQATLLAAPAESMAGQRFNDGRCDRQGRFWSGTLALDQRDCAASGRLYRLDSGTISAPIVTGLVTQNGLAWSPDGCTMYLSDSHASRQIIWAFDYDTATGVPSSRRVFVDMRDYPGRPDGAAIDVDGCYWICANDAGMLHRFTPAGRLDRSITLPLAKPSMCSFGGARMDQLLVTSISAGAPAGDALAGAVLLIEPGIAGLPETRFS